MKNEDIKKIIEGLLATLPVRIDAVEVVEAPGKAPIFVIKSADSPALIGAHGTHFHALSLLIKKMVGAKAEAAGIEEPRFFIDVNDYRSGIAQTLATKASILAERARSFKSSVEMEPMSSYERLIIHEYLADAPNIKTESVGEGKNRRVIIKYVEGDTTETF